MIKSSLKLIKKKAFVFGNLRRIIFPNRINVYYWKRNDGRDNVGDVLSRVIFDFVSTLNNKNPNALISKTKRIMVIGSIIGLADQRLVVWGSGLLHNNSVEPIKGIPLDIRAVRGPKTREILVKNGFRCPQNFGDPGILLPLFYNPSVEKKVKFKVIPHHLKEINYRKNECSFEIISTITADWKAFILSILEAEFIISSSLHGIILAEAYGVPAILLNEVEGSLFKYEDYYQSTNRKTFKIASSIEEAILLGPEEVPDLSPIQQKLLSSFPTDLWT
jgi:pyruvyltransferase